MSLKLFCTMAIILSVCDSNPMPDSKSELQSENLDQKYYPRNCAEALMRSQQSGIYEIRIPSYSKNPFRVLCDTSRDDGGWTVILRRMDGSENFYRNWNAYKNGFGNLNGEFFLGLDKINALTSDLGQELMVLLDDFTNVNRYEKYESFGIADEDEQYALNTLGLASGTAGDSLSYHRNMKFSTFDRSNAPWMGGNCAANNTGAWWYSSCLDSNLAGKYNDSRAGKGVVWSTIKGRAYSLKRATMMIRPKM